MATYRAKPWDERKHKRGPGGKFARKTLAATRSTKQSSRSLRRSVTQARNRKRAVLGKPPLSDSAVSQGVVRAARARTALQKKGIVLSPADQKALKTLVKGATIRLSSGVTVSRGRKNNYKVRR